jgi:uncharacterized protein with HEPN domain
MPRDDTIRLRHMLDAAREAMEFASGRTRRDLDSNRMLVLSLVKEIEINCVPAQHGAESHPFATPS